MRTIGRLIKIYFLVKTYPFRLIHLRWRDAVSAVTSGSMWEGGTESHREAIQ